MESRSSARALLQSLVVSKKLKPGSIGSANSREKVESPVRLSRLPAGSVSSPKKPQHQQQQQEESQNQLISAASFRKASPGVRISRLGSKRITKVPKLSFNSKRRGRGAISNQNNGLDGDGEPRQVNAGVYLLQNTKTGHRFFGTTWDLYNAAAQSFHDLQRGVHPHQALSTCFQLYGETASGIHFRVLERVSPPSSPKPPPRPNPNKSKRRRLLRRPLGADDDDDGFDVRAMERKLAVRLRFHQRKLVKRAAYKIVRQYLVVPVLARAWLRWVQVAESCVLVEQLAAALEIQRVARGHLARVRTGQLRQDHAARKLQRFMRRSHFTLRCRRRARIKLEKNAACIIQRSMRELVARQKSRRRRKGIIQWLVARKLQAHIRGHLARCLVRRMRQDNARNSAAIHLQRMTRGHLSRLRVHRLRWDISSALSATLIQKIWRGYSARAKVKLQRSLGGALATHRHLHQYPLEEIRDEAARTIQQAYNRWKAWRLEGQKAKPTLIYTAYRNYVAKKFGWAALRLLLETSMANRIQRAGRRWVFQQRLRRLMNEYRREKAALTIQCSIRQHQSRGKLNESRRERKRRQAAKRIQAFWRSCWLLLELHKRVTARKRERAARCIQASYRQYKARCEYLEIRDLARCNRAATKVQCLYRARQARREMMRRQVVRRMGACENCRAQLATVYHFTARSELCAACCNKFNSGDGSDMETLDVYKYRRLQRHLVSAQRAYHTFQQRMSRQFGVCTLCEKHAVRRSCWECLQGRGAHRLTKKRDGKALLGLTFCRSCDALFHEKSIGSSRLTQHKRKDIEVAYAEDKAAVAVQKYYRRFAQRRTLTRLRLAREVAAAKLIQDRYRRHRQRRLTRAICAARRKQHVVEDSAVLAIQRVVRGYLARCKLRRLQLERDCAIEIQRTFRRYQTRRRHSAAVTIQRNVRGWLARRVVDILRQERLKRERNAAARCIQRHVRGFIERRRLLHAKERAAAVRIQCAWRGYVARYQLAELRLKKLQAFQNELRAKLRVLAAQIAENERLAATRIQTIVRGRQARDELYRRKLQAARHARERLRRSAIALEASSATCIQRRVREKITNIAGRQRLRAQCCARCFLSRLFVRRRRLEKQSAVRIQRAFRYSRAKRRLAEMVGAEGDEAVPASVGWVELFDETSGYVYYYHAGTGESVWERPAEMDLQTETPEDTAAEDVGEWVEYWDENVGASYFYNVKTGEATWTTPPGYQSSNQEDIAAADAWPLENGGTYYTLQSRSKVSQMEPGNQQLETYSQDGNQYYAQNGYEYGDAYAYGNNENGDGGYYYYYGDSTADGAAYTYPQEDDVLEPVDTEYDINYKIYLTQMERQNQEEQQEQQDDQEDGQEAWQGHKQTNGGAGF